MAVKTKKKEKCFVLDTSILLYSANSITAFGPKDVFIPYIVLNELDTFKTSINEKGKNSRDIIRKLNEYRVSGGNLSVGVEVNEKGGILKVIQSGIDNDKDIKNDDKILEVCKELHNLYKEVILVTRDICLSAKSDALGIKAQEFQEDCRIEQADDLYTGVVSLEVDQKVIDGLYSQGAVQSTFSGLFPNQFLLLKNKTNSKHSAIVRVSADTMYLSVVRDTGAWGLTAKNVKQKFAFNLLLDDEVKLVTLAGIAGTGKTLLALSAGLQKVLEEKKYDSLIITRPVSALEDNDLGFLPGSISDKFEPWIRPIRDQVEFLFGSRRVGEQEFDNMIAAGIIRVEPLAYIRGRSFHNNFIILDEGQGTSKSVVKTLLTRAGLNTKIVITGDIQQIDNNNLDSINNGLSQVIERFKEIDLAGHITLDECERSTLAQIAATIM